MMKKFLLSKAVLLSLIVTPLFADNSINLTSTVPAKAAALQQAQLAQSNSCVLDAIGDSLTSMVQAGLQNSAVTFASDSNVQQTLENLQSTTCSESKDIKISAKDNLVIVTGSSSKNSYEFDVWYKDGQAVCAILN